VKRIGGYLQKGARAAKLVGKGRSKRRRPVRGRQRLVDELSSTKGKKGREENGDVRLEGHNSKKIKIKNS